MFVLEDAVKFVRERNIFLLAEKKWIQTSSRDISDLIMAIKMKYEYDVIRRVITHNAPLRIR